MLTRQQISTMATQWIDEINVKRLDTGFAENQPDWPYWVQPKNYSSFEWADMDVWICATFGDTDWSTPGGRWVGSDRKYWFRYEADRTWFILKWS
jgi:hypothetical protein